MPLTNPLFTIHYSEYLVLSERLKPLFQAPKTLIFTRLLVPSTGIEPVFQAPEACVLSVKL